MSQRSRFVRPETRVLKISRGDTLTVRRRLNRGEEAAMFSRIYVAAEGGAMRVNRLQLGLATVIAYLLDWSLVDEDQRRVEIEGKSADELEAILNALDPADFAEIRDAVDAHVAEMDAERAAGKQSDGETKSPATSPSPVDAGGATSGSGS